MLHDESEYDTGSILFSSFEGLFTMNKILSGFKKPKVLSRQRKGQGLTEYAMILALVAIVVIFALALLGPAVGGAFSNILMAAGAPPTATPEGAPEPPEPPPECYGSLLLPIMVGSTGLIVGISSMWPKKAVADQAV